MKKKLVSAACLLAIVISGAITAARWSRPESPLAGEELTLIDRLSQQTETLTMRAWHRRGKDLNGVFKNVSGQYEMVPAEDCALCGATIPLLVPPQTALMDSEAEEAALAAYEIQRRQYVCPKCGGHPFAPAPG